MLPKVSQVANYESRLKQFVIPITLLIALLPALSRWWLGQLPAGADTAVHFYRAVELNWLIQNGILYSRWLPDFVFGYGYPLFNYYGPFANYLIVFFYFVGLAFIPATLAAFALTDVFGAFGAYLLARDTLGKLPGLIAAIAYAYSPYLLASLYRGALPESIGLALLPWLLWSLYRLWHQPSPHRLVFAAFLFALFPITHNPSTALASVIALAFILALLFSHHASRISRYSLFIVYLSLFIGLALSAFFWLPIIFEIQYIDIAKAYAPDVINYHHNFLALEKVIAPPQPIDPNLIGTNIVYGLGWPQLILAFISLFAFRRRTPEQKVLLGLSLFALPLLVFLTLPQSVKVWETVPGLSLIQFPARLLGPASLLLALLVGSVFVDSTRAGGLRAIVVATSVAAIILFGFGWLYTGTDRTIPAQPTLADIHAYEHRTGVVGTTTAAEYLPKWVQERPPDLYLDYAQPPINRIVVPSDVTIISETPGPLTQHVELETPTDFTAVFTTFYFPGWAATVDGQTVSVAPTSGQGLISFVVPAGRHTLTLQFTDTPPRTIGILISLVTLATTIIVAFWIKFGVRAESPADHDGLPRNQLVAIAGVGLALMGVKLLYTDHTGSLFLQSKLDHIQHPVSVTFGDQLELLGYDDDGTLYWRAMQSLSVDWSVSAVLEYDGHRVAQADSQHPAGLPTSRWFTDQYARDGHGLTPMPGTPPGAYELRVTVYRQSDGLVLQPANVLVGEVQVSRPTQPAILTPSVPVESNLGPLKLLGIDTVSRIGVGDALPVTFYWEALDTTSQDFLSRLVLLDDQDQIVTEQKTPPTRPDFGTSLWQVGDRWIGFGELPIPPDLAGGQYTLAIGDPSRPIRISAVQVIAPERSFDAPALAHPLDIQFGESIKLLGWDISDNQSTNRQLILYWQPLTLINQRYTVFVHVLDANGNLIAQRDSQPVNGARPTTSWLPPEAIADSYDLTLPEGAAAVRVGLYDPQTSHRLVTSTGEEFVIIQPR
jgi:hypothetical protein